MWGLMTDLSSNQTMAAATTETTVRKPIQRWSAARKRDVVLRLLRGESIEAVSRQVAVEPYRLEQWRERALAAIDAGLKDRAEDDRSRPGWLPPTNARANSARRTNCCARRLPAWRAACPFTGRGGDLARRLPELRHAMCLLHFAMPAVASRTKRGTRLIATSPRSHWKTSTFIGRLRQDSLIAPAVLPKG
jgi:hypothetical protein